MTVFNTAEVVDAIDGLNEDILARWIAFGWVAPIEDGAQTQFDASDLARVRLICELHFELLIDEDSVPVVLSLLDQLYATRRALRDVVAAVAQQSPQVRADIARLIARKTAR